jgi:SAM-dependent methyltransferase
LVNRLKAVVRKDYRTKSSRTALSQVLEAGSKGHLCLSVGGGPLRINPGVTNLNISCFPNVDVVADAHVLPYGNSTVDSIHCEAVLEHLSDPLAAVTEMVRVLKPGGKVIAVTPFLQRFHGYPYHFQNFTLVGHSLIFQRAGFEVLESGTCVGPTYAIVNLVSAYFTQCLPKVIGLPLAAAWNIAGICLLPLDLALNRPASSHVLASTTYVLAQKPAD